MRALGKDTALPIMVRLFGAGGGAVVVLGRRAVRYQWQGPFLLSFLLAMIVACLAEAALLSSVEAWIPWEQGLPSPLPPLKPWEVAGPLLLFLGLLTLLNAPFDWASLGLTRALLRRGLEREGWWPYCYAVVDALFATGIIACLAFVMVFFVQAFDELAVHGGGKPVLPLDTFFDGIAKNPAAPEYWWSMRCCFRP